MPNLCSALKDFGEQEMKIEAESFMDILVNLVNDSYTGDNFISESQYYCLI